MCIPMYMYIPGAEALHSLTTLVAEAIMESVREVQIGKALRRTAQSDVLFLKQSTR